MGKSATQIEVETILLDSADRFDRPSAAPLAGAGQAASTTDEGDVPPPPSHVLVRSVSVVLVAVALLGLFVLSRQVERQQSFDAVAFKDILSVLKGLDRLADGTTIDLTIRGPGAVPGVAGALVSEGTTLHVHRWRSGETFVRGRNDHGSLTYRFLDGSLYASKK